MRTAWMALAALLLTACAPPAATGPDATVLAIYRITAQKMGHELTNVDDIPLSDDLARLLHEGAETAERNNEPFIDGDLAANCQDCTSIGPVTATVTSPSANGRAVVEAHFLLDGRPSVVIWDMVESPQGWRVDNIRSPDGYDLRASVSAQAAENAQSCANEIGAERSAALVAQCTSISAATHPPCNAANACALIQGEIARSCAQTAAKDRPAFCASPAYSMQ